MKIDMHCHSFYSDDGLCSPEALLKSAKKRGLDGIALTDHDTTKGWNRAIKAAKELRMALILGEEIKIKRGRKTMGEILGYFLKKEIDPKGKTIEQVIDEIKGQGGIAIIAHPYHWKKPFLQLDKYKNLVDGIEAFNARSQSKRGNQKAIDFAKKNKLAVTAGSDAHHSLEVGDAYLEVEASNLEEFKETILREKMGPVREYKTPKGFKIIQFSNKVRIVGKQSPIFVQSFASLGRLIHLFWQVRS